jgi:hypothetical protein
MTITQILLMSGFYLLLSLAVIAWTRATPRRVSGALAGGAAVAVYFAGVIPLGEAFGLWHVPMQRTPTYLALFYGGTIVACVPTLLITWRVARRFGRRGLAACLAAAALIGPPRDYAYAAMFPEWITFGPGLAPVLAVSATYVGFVALGHAVMQLVAGPAGQDPLARVAGNRLAKEANPTTP